MDTRQAWTKMFEVYTDGDNVWAMRDGERLASRAIGQDIDGPEAALQDATIELVRDLAYEPRAALA